MILRLSFCLLYTSMCFGIIIGTRAYFNSELAKDVRKQLLRTLADEGYDYVILPEQTLKTGEISDYHNKGMHTTTFSEMFPVDRCV